MQCLATLKNAASMTSLDMQHLKEAPAVQAASEDLILTVPISVIYLAIYLAIYSAGAAEEGAIQAMDL